MILCQIRPGVRDAQLCLREQQESRALPKHFHLMALLLSRLPVLVLPVVEIDRLLGFSRTHCYYSAIVIRYSVESLCGEFVLGCCCRCWKNHPVEHF
jgi:hypothetical protein